ncbi:hypothetical protein HPB50_006608 [Hyalomma asiaticum]|uniref:Uncharacterized protein n=1 Tax=Hyalomma asiaticum TaxID=266040 RepID=A0ACB7S9R3_HYAAI|nr:hypothetical protein HPB50_006608 [Hyalomma asiaticum]
MAESELRGVDDPATFFPAPLFHSVKLVVQCSSERGLRVPIDRKFVKSDSNQPRTTRRPYPVSRHVVARRTHAPHTYSRSRALDELPHSKHLAMSRHGNGRAHWWTRCSRYTFSGSPIVPIDERSSHRRAACTISAVSALADASNTSAYCGRG